MASHSDILTKTDLEGNVISELQINGINSWIGDFSAQDEDYFYTVVIDPSIRGQIYQISKEAGNIEQMINGDWTNEVSQALAFDKDNHRFWISGWLQDNIINIDNEGNLLHQIPANQFQNITGMEWDNLGRNEEGSLWIISKNPNYLREINPITGDIITEISTGENQFNGLSFDSNRNFWTASLTERAIYSIKGPSSNYIPDWISISSLNETLLPNETVTLNIVLGNEDIEPGAYSCQMLIISNATNLPEIIIPIDINISPVSNEQVDEIVIRDNLSNNPNPFNPETTINYSISKEGKVIIDIFNIKGQKVKCLVNDNLKSGNYKTLWNGTNSRGNRVSSGVYMYRMKTASGLKVNKMIMLK